MKTREEVEELKRQWAKDPQWDIEATEGFEDHRAELSAFHAAKLIEWAPVATVVMPIIAAQAGLIELTRYQPGAARDRQPVWVKVAHIALVEPVYGTIPEATRITLAAGAGDGDGFLAVEVRQAPKAVINAMADARA